jgi:hypothetical protein
MTSLILGGHFLVLNLEFVRLLHYSYFPLYHEESIFVDPLLVFKNVLLYEKLVSTYIHLKRNELEISM